MSQIIPIFIPTYISSQTYAPARVLPRIFFYNGQVECETWYVADENNVGQAVTTFPYFDNYSVITGSFPTDGSRSLLFNNEAPPYGTTPTASLYTEYWDSYVNLLYNPRTRLINCSAIIPLADYFKMELNDICSWRGNYYHLRAINNYNLSNGECQLQLLGPILPDILPDILPAIRCNFDYTITEITTTTTTIPPCAGCRSYTFTATGSGANVDLYWIDCEGTIQNINSLTDGEQVAICSLISGSYPFYSASVGAGILSSCGPTCSCECYDYTQSYSTGNYSYYDCTQAVGVGTPLFGTFTGTDVGIITCISSGSATIGITPVAPNTGSGGCTGCATTTTTTTTTSTTTTTTTQAPTTTTTTIAGNSEWTASNLSCGAGTVNDVGINGSFIGTLSGPSTFPLTSTLYGYKSNPNGINYGSTNTIQANVTTNIAGTGNCAVLRVVINGVEPTPHETYFTTNPAPQVSGVTINSGDDVWVYVECISGSCPP